jgi:hypothetical protein
MVPMRYFRNDRRVMSIMVEVNLLAQSTYSILRFTDHSEGGLAAIERKLLVSRVSPP